MKPWNERCDVAFPCASQNELDQSDAINLVNSGCRILIEGSVVFLNNSELFFAKLFLILVFWISQVLFTIVMNCFLLLLTAFFNFFRFKHALLSWSSWCSQESECASCSFYGYWCWWGMITDLPLLSHTWYVLSILQIVRPCHSTFITGCHFVPSMLMLQLEFFVFSNVL